MTRTEGSDGPTREMPQYSAGRANPPGPDDPARAGDDPTWDEPGGEDPQAAPRRKTGRLLVWLISIVGLIAVLAIGTRAIGWWPELRNPFAQQQVDRSQPPLLKSIQDLSRYTAAEGNFEIVIDLQKNRKYVPDFLLNQRTLFVAAGTVEAYVDFSTISEGAISVSQDKTSVDVRLPAPQLTPARLDLDRSYVFAEQRGLLNRLGDVFGGDPNRQQETYKLSKQRIEAAARDSKLSQRAEENTRKMLEGLLRSLGYRTVTVTFVAT